MKSLIIYCFLSFLPFAMLFGAAQLDLVSSSWFVGLLFFYLLVYRTLLDGMRLVKKGFIKENEIWKTPFLAFSKGYFRALYWK